MSRKDVEAIVRIRGRLGTFIRVYTALEAKLNPNAARVFELFLYHDNDRLSRGAEWFVLTDEQGAVGSGLSVKQFRDGRDLLCDPLIYLFHRQRFFSFGNTHYHANHDRIHAWLTVNGFAEGLPAPVQSSAGKHSLSSVHKRDTDRWTKGTPTGGHFVPPFQKIGTDFFDDDDGARAAREQSLLKELAISGIQEPTLSALARQMSAYADALEGLREENDILIERDLFIGGNPHKPNKRIRSGTGLLISRLRTRYPALSPTEVNTDA